MVKDQEGGWLGFVRNLFQGTLVNLLALPDKLRKTLDIIKGGELETRTPDILIGARLLYLAARQWLLALLGLAAIVLAQWFYTIHEAQSAQIAYTVAAIFGLLFIQAWRKGSRFFREMK
jgi:hypothetical protein